MTRIKICGIRSQEEALDIVKAGADAIGFIFAPASKRYIEPQKAGRISKSLSPFTSRIGVFVNSSSTEVCEIAKMASLTGIQLHGDEDPKEFLDSSLPIIKALRFPIEPFKSSNIFSQTDILKEKLLSWKGIVQAVLLDSVHEGKFGGTGYAISWNNPEFQAYCQVIKDVGVPLILAGGLNPDNVRSGIRTVKPYAVDVSSGVEREGKKDLDLVKQFIIEVRAI